MKGRKHTPEEIVRKLLAGSGCWAKARIWQRWPRCWRSVGPSSTAGGTSTGSPHPVQFEIAGPQ